MKNFLTIVGIIPTIGLAIHNMGNLTYEKACAYGLVLLFSFLFIFAMWFLYGISNRKLGVKGVLKLKHHKKESRTQKRSTKKVRRKSHNRTKRVS